MQESPKFADDWEMFSEYAQLGMKILHSDLIRQATAVRCAEIRFLQLHIG